jgi:hypothetical protein
LLISTLRLFISPSPLPAVIDNEFCKSLCLRICPEVASFTRRRVQPGAARRSTGYTPASAAPSPPPRSPPRAALHRRLQHRPLPLRERGEHARPAGHGQQPPVLLVQRRRGRPQRAGDYRLNSDLCVVDEIRVQPFQGTRSCLCFLFSSIYEVAVMFSSNASPTISIAFRVASVFSGRASYLLPKGCADSDGPFQARSWIRVLCHA